VKERAFRHYLGAPQWSGDFVKPADAQSTPSFGMTRLLNEELTSEHRGTDFPIKEGEPVVASNSGTVVLARELFYEGNCIIIDHGQHFFTEYMHLSKIQVKVGQKVEKSQRIGLTGATGRVTGPHLHMGVRWETSYLDPTKLLALTLPETRKTAAVLRSRRRRK
jgi:murein DD-endopeptidase MepM/ murein hydrolase activator NlpD